MQENRNSNADPDESSGSLQRDSQSQFQLSVKLRDKLEKLEQWRIQPSSIQLPEAIREFRGGYAAVSKAVLVFPSDIGRQDSHSVKTGDNSVQGEESKHEEQNPSGQTSERKIVAVKKMKIDRDTDIERVLGLALREAEFLLKLSHRNIVKFEGFIEDASSGVICLVFPWEENGNLRDFLAAGEWEIPERISLIDDVAKGLEYLHIQTPPICHGDLKSLNILVNSEYSAVITDFGSARRLGNEDPGKQTREGENTPQPGSDPTTEQGNTQPQALFCATTNTITLTGNNYTVRWAAPELLKDELPCLGSDIWALGWIAYEVMTNSIPFHDVKNENIVVKRVVQGDLPSITNDARMSLIRALCSLMVRCWSIDPEKRPTAENCRKLISWMPMITPATRQDMNTEVSQPRYADLLRQLGHMYMRQGDYLNASSCFTKALDIHTSTMNNKGRALTLSDLADVHLYRGEYSEAASLSSEALQIFTDTDDQEGRAHTLWLLAEIHRLQREYGDSIKFYSEVLQIWTDGINRHGRANAVWGLATVYLRQGEYSRATTLYSEALQIYSDIGSQRDVAITLWGLAEVHRHKDEFTEAIKLYSEALQIYTNVGDQREIAVTLWCLAEIHVDQGEYSQAIARYSEALQIETEIGNKRGRAETLRSLARVHRKQDHRNDAISFYLEASEAFGEIGDSDEAAKALNEVDEIRKSFEGV